MASKVNTEQIYLIWRNFAISIVTLLCLKLVTLILPPLVAPILSTVAAATLYFIVFSNSYIRRDTCVIVPYAMFITLLLYTILLVVLNLLDVWGLINIPLELVFFERPFVPTLLLAPTGLVVSLFMYARHDRLSICVNCKINNGGLLERGHTGIILNRESRFQLRNLAFIFGLVSVVVWGYYTFLFLDASISPRDRFVFSWVSITIYLMDTLYFGIRYYNLYLDLKDSDELISPDDIRSAGTTTGVRFYVICGDSIYLSGQKRAGMDIGEDSDAIDTPFMFKRMGKSVPSGELQQIVARQTGVEDGKVQFFYGRRRPDVQDYNVMRYFYFLPGEPEDYPQLAQEGEWISADKVKTVYNFTPHRFSFTFLADFQRLAIIMITKKTFKENGDRRLRLQQYRPTFSLQELQGIDVDFNDDMWLRVANFNASVRFFRLKRWWKRHFTQPK